MTRARSIALALLLASAPIALAQTDAPTPQPQTPPQAQREATPPPAVKPEPALVMRELLVLQTDRYDDTANNPKLVPTTLFTPIRHQDRAKRVDAKGAYEFAPMPLGLITFQGRADEPMKLRLTLTDPRDRFHAHWPGNAIQGDRFLQWQDLRFDEDPQRRATEFADQHAWLSNLRRGDGRVWFHTPSGLSKERFILYDVSIHFTPAISLTSADTAYRLSNSPKQPAPPMSVLVRKTDAGWSGDAIASPWPAKTTTVATKNSGVDSADMLAQALTPIKEILTSRGYNEQEIGLALQMIASAGFDKSRMSLVYILPVGVIDEHIRLQVRPMPDEIIRTTIVVVNNVDPDLSSVINALLDDLGSDQWTQRNRAQRELIELGQAAIKKVQQLKSDKDPEIAFRARQILDAYDLKMNDK